MPEEIKPDPNQATTQDAQLAADSIAGGQEKAADVDVDADYEASKQYSVSDIDRTGAGVKAAEEATAPQFKLSEPEETKLETGPTGDPDDYRDMASDIGPKA